MPTRLAMLGAATALITSCSGRPALSADAGTPDAGVDSGGEVDAGCAAGDLFIAPTVGAFGTVCVGEAPCVDGGFLVFTVSWPGCAPTGALSTALSGRNASEFAITSDGCSGLVLKAGTACLIEASFKPVGPLGLDTAMLTATAVPGGTAAATLTGTAGGCTAFTLTPTPEDFGLVTLGQSATAVFTLANNESFAAGPFSAVVSGTDAIDFTVVSNGCMTTLASGATCLISVAFSPSSLGSKQAALGLSDCDAMAAAELLGTGVLADAGMPDASIDSGTNPGDAGESVDAGDSG